jgi:hypothetical protein
MGLVVSVYRAREPLSLLPRLREETERRLGARVRLIVEPAIHQLSMRGQTVVLTQRGDVLEVCLPAHHRFWLAQTRGEIARIERALRTLGAERIVGLRALRFRWRVSSPGIERIAEALEGRVTNRFPPWAYLRSGWRTSVEIALSDDTFELQAPVVIFGGLYEHAVAAAETIGERIPLGQGRRA